MISLITSIFLLILGYFVLGKFFEKILGADPNSRTPARQKSDGVDFIILPTWKVFLIQFLNIAGLGPIFGAIAGALWGPVAFIWIVLGSLFAGGIHDYFSGMLSLRHGGQSIAEVTGHYLGSHVKIFMRGFTVILMILVGAVFILGPAKILEGLAPNFLSTSGWIAVIIFYYLLSTILPIDKVIGRIYPFFGSTLLFMALGLLFAIFSDTGTSIPEIGWNSFQNFHYGGESFPIFPMVCVTIACGAISGFHSTQSPIMARCMKNEMNGRPVFYGAMITEGVVALIWAAISMSFFGGVEELNTTMRTQDNNAAWVVNKISTDLLGSIGGVLAIIGVVAAPITSGDTSFRSARSILSDFINLDQSRIKNRLILSVPLFVVGFGLTLIDFGVVWRYFAWTNQTLATVVLWTITSYLIKEGKNYWVGLIPAFFMSIVVTSYILIAPEGLSLPVNVSILIGFGVALSIALVVIIPFNVLNRINVFLNTRQK